MQLNPYLTFNGQCETAFKFYEQCLGGKIEEMMSYGESPMAEEVPSEWRNKIIHASLIVDDRVLMGSDCSPEQYEETKGCSVLLHIDDPVKAERIFQALVENGTVRMPMQETFWSASFGMLVDQFGIPWMINSEPAV
ncbi:VOC family protein [Gloeocapsopsis crepidinum LEGE 06123]|uniref:VOC family protein n=1 Tax=Gloeocapsopsis crepidinum LEGE 06123 TaxID=588587 RepID=A0ABR9UY99_9CHRO|nr:VOC family protein [Gloeocapsopsis crepidinum]MBE9193293.1 VOC family protein [Gloeocapsopsis crepidinum LEGE 06123]